MKPPTPEKKLEVFVHSRNCVHVSCLIIHVTFYEKWISIAIMSAVHGI